MTVMSTMLSNAGEFEDLWRWQRKEDEGTAESDRTCDAWNCWSCKDWKCRRFIRCNQAALYFAYTKEGSPRSFKERCSWWGRNSDTESWEGAESQIKPGFRCTFDTFACLISYYNIISKLYLYFMDIRSMPSTPNSGGAAKGGSRSPSAEEKSCRGGRCDKRCQRCRLKWDDSVVILGDDEDDPWTGESGDKVTAIHVVSDEYRLRRCVWCNSRRYLAWVDQFGLLF